MELWLGIVICIGGGLVAFCLAYFAGGGGRR